VDAVRSVRRPRIGRSLAGTVALMDQLRVVACQGDSSSPSCFSFVRWVPVPARCDLVGGALISPLRVVLPRRGRTPCRTRGRCRPRHDLPVVQRFTPLVIDAAKPCRHSVGDRWFVDETYVKVAGVWRYVYRAVDQHGQVIDVLVSKRRNAQRRPASSRRCWRAVHGPPRSPRIWSHRCCASSTNFLPDALHDTTQYGNNRIECDHGRLKARLRPMRGLRTDRGGMGDFWCDLQGSQPLMKALARIGANDARGTPFSIACLIRGAVSVGNQLEYA
jgi:hypothetical protein